MQWPNRVAQPPPRPLMIFDGDCGFCRTWIARWRQLTGERVDYAPYQEAAERFPEIPLEGFRRAVQVVLPDGRAFGGAEAVARTLAVVPGRGAFLWTYRRVPGAAAVADLAYRVVASHRDAASAVTRLLWGRSVEKPTYFAATALFVRLVGLAYLSAFLSLWVQVDGLIGSHGLLPASEFLSWAHAQVGSSAYRLLPTLCWISASDGFLHVLCALGCLAGALLLAGFVPCLAALAAWLLYLSLAIVGQTFLEFQWDFLLLETGLLAVLLVSPRRWRFGGGLAASGIALGLLRWLLFRLMFSSGWVKLASGDPSWRSLRALDVHYQTQPLPPWTAWYMHHLPAGFQTFSVLFLFAVELALPFLFFAPRRARLFAARTTIFLQLVIAATGNYAFFNLLSVALAILLLDDRSFPRPGSEAALQSAGRGRAPWPRAVMVPAAAVILLASTISFAATLVRSLALPAPAVAFARAVAPFRSANGYGLFAVMTTKREEIVIEGSDDGASWRAYEFPWKPGDPRRRPAFVAPHQPRLDWQMWFAALGGIEENPWLERLLVRLLEGAPDVERLLSVNPFPGRPPRFVRAVLWDYRFTTAAERQETGAWWRRRPLGLYAPVLSRSTPTPPGP